MTKKIRLGHRDTIHAHMHANSSTQNAKSSAQVPSLPTLTCITFRVSSSLECDWKRKTMHWSSLDSLLLSALQQKHGREKGRRKKKSITYTSSSLGELKKGKNNITPLSGCHTPMSLAMPCLWLCALGTHWACAERRSKQSRSEAQLF